MVSSVAKGVAKKEPPLIIICTIILILAVLISLNAGRYAVSLVDIWNIAIGNYDDNLLAFEKYTVFINLRLPRIIFAVCVGCALSVSGAVLQSLFRNPLASPNIVGVMHGSNFGAALAISIFASYSTTSFVINAFSFIFGMLAIFIAYTLSMRSRDDSIAVIVLIGIVVSSVFQAGVSLITYLADPYGVLPKITYRLMGSLQAATWKNIYLPVPLILISTLCIIIFSWRLNVMSLSDEEALTLGVNIHKWRFIYLMLATLLVASAVAVCGNIMWIGLIVPHITRQLVGADNKKLVPLTALMGSIFLVVIDTLVRSVTEGEVPVSIVTSFIGAPFLGYLVLRDKGSG